MTPQQFVAKWSQIQQMETAVSQSHFNDLCQLVGHKPPLEHDPSGQNFSFETQTVKSSGGKGFADVYYRDKFIWEYKGPHKDLDRAYQQLQLYREALDNPPLLITCNIHTIHIHTNFTNYPTRKHTITLDDILSGEGLEKLRWAFFTPEKFTPEKTKANITKATADTLLAVAEQMKQHRDILEDGAYTNEQLAHFLVRLLFALFAEDMGLLPDNLFTQIVRARGGSYADLQPVLRELFGKMRGGGTFGMWPIRHFNGTLFDDDFVPAIPHDLGRALLQAAEQDWSQVDPSIFGTLFERVIDEGKRAQLGAHYTSESDIMLIVEPVLMEPLKRKWDAVRRESQTQTQTLRVSETLRVFAEELAATRVLDPACGSGNFLYVALRELLDLQKEVIAYAARRELPPIELTVSPEQLYGIEINPYAHELAQITAWIGYLQWRNENGFGEITDPILRPLHNIQRMDAILAYDADGSPTEPEWPAADVIIGNPPFLGGNKIRQELGDETVDNLFKLYDGRVPAFADLVCYWFEKARAQIETGNGKRAGLIATNSIRGGVNREVLKRIKETGDIFMAWSDNPWILDGAAVRVSIVGFDSGSQQTRHLNGQNVSVINSDLTRLADLTLAKALNENIGLAFRGNQKGGDFDIPENLARQMLNDSQNEMGYLNSDVVKPLANGMDITRRPRDVWLIDFGINMSIKKASKYVLPFKYVEEHVYPVRKSNRRKAYREKWWIHAEARPSMRKAIAPLKRYAVTPHVSKHHLCVWLSKPTIPDHQLIVFAREDDYFFGVLHSRLHEIWALRLGTSLEDRPRYTPSTTFETFPLPWPPGQEPSELNPQVAAIAHWARALVQWRDAWLNPPPPPAGVIDVAYAKRLKARTLTNLYNGLVYYRQTVRRPLGSGGGWDAAEFRKVTRGSATRSEIQELDDIHMALDNAVLDAYGWPHDVMDEAILERLLALNLSRA
jgi:type II restriction/modification system DNA methylase subunit YeeA